MIYIQDNFLQKPIFNKLQEYCNQDFKIITVGNKKYSTLPTPNQLLPLLQIDGYSLTLTFIRSAYKTFDTDLRIHADNIINGKKTHLASVLYINDNSVTKNGTAFYKHIKYGRELPENVTNSEFDYLINNDANDSGKWNIQDIVVSVPNRLLTYKASYFHAKYPSVIDKGVRKVLVAFYSKN